MSDACQLSQTFEQVVEFVSVHSRSTDETMNRGSAALGLSVSKLQHAKIQDLYSMVATCTERLLNM